MSLYIFTFVFSPGSTHNRPNASPVGRHHAHFYPLVGHPDASVPLLPKHKFIAFSPASRVGASEGPSAAIMSP